MSGARSQSADRQLRGRTISIVQPVSNSFNNMPPAASKAIHLPSFQAKDVEFWFLQVEAMFRTANITNDQCKFDLVITALDLQAAADIRDVLRNPPDEDRYEAIKKALVDRLAVSESARIERILSNEPIGDRTPSQHLRHLQAIAGNNFSAQVLTSLWLKTLPSDVKLVVAGTMDTLPLDKLAAMADNVQVVAGARRATAAIEAPANPNLPSAADIASLTKQISALTKRFDSHLSRATERPDGASRPKQPRAKSPAAPRSRPAAPAENGVCWYHRKFKEQATRCAPPCSWSGPDARPPASGNETIQS